MSFENFPLDKALYDVMVEPEGISFLKTQTGITDNEELKAHILDLQAKAYAVEPYPCIRAFRFTRLKISKLPAYNQALKLGREREGAILLDIGCCFGNDSRKAAQDGFPTHNIIASDLRKEFWELGHELFKTTPETFPARFIAGDAFDPSMLQVILPRNSVSTARPELSTLKSLNPLRGHISAIHASSFFHLFNEERQLHMARALAGLLSPEPGSVIFGSHGGIAQKGMATDDIFGQKFDIFCHCPESWIEMWDGQVFEKGTVKVEARLKELPMRDKAHDSLSLLAWSVTRL
ncbi:hypothetical protein BJ138DRAFT_1174876 [Hygrophoropsis aurantiaca]|uniref:Uncharacterized protein n=1 Tax=Hygrophoropsis aurantiaca TaxID=72124 RepID=A0ACB7ZZR7_9AGAM|nr:hypothetical protein BJ138DRAFT_1174876 [Hygrophoropsis aurantiaca]